MKKKYCTYRCSHFSISLERRILACPIQAISSNLRPAFPSIHQCTLWMLAVWQGIVMHEVVDCSGAEWIFPVHYGLDWSRFGVWRSAEASSQTPVQTYPHRCIAGKFWATRMRVAPCPRGASLARLVNRWPWNFKFFEFFIYKNSEKNTENKSCRIIFSRLS